MLERPAPSIEASNLVGGPAEAPGPSHHPARAHGFHSLLFLLPVPKGFPSSDVPMLEVGSHFFPYIPIKAPANVPWEDADAWGCAGRLEKEVQTKETSKEHRQLFPSSLNHPKAQSTMNKSLSFEHEPFDQTSEVSLYVRDKVRTSNSSTVSVHLGVTYSKHPTPFPLYFRASFVKSESLLMFWFVFSFTSLSIWLFVFIM